MLSALGVFERSLNEAKHLTSLYDYLSDQMKVPYSFDDLLRAQIVYAVAAFDKLMHDIIRIGMLESFSGARSPTPKYLSETISLEFHGNLLAAQLPPKEFLFEREVVTKLSWQSFQDPEKIAGGLALIWPEKNKWDKISASMGLAAKAATTQLKLIATRRNAIVHESDMDPLTNAKTPLTRAECRDITDFLGRCGQAIVALVN